MQVLEAGLPGPLDLAPVPVGVGREQALGTAPHLTILNVAMVMTLSSIYVAMENAQVRVYNIMQLYTIEQIIFFQL